MMHKDIFLLAERLVIAVERISEDVNNISAYVYDLSHSVSCILNENREKERISLDPCDEGVNLQTGTPVAGREAYVKNERYSPYEQADARSMSPADVAEHEELSAGDVASMNPDPNQNSDILRSFTERIKCEEQSDREENGESSGGCNVFENGRRNITGSSKEMNQQSHFKYSVASGGPHIAPSFSHFLSVETVGMNSEEQISKDPFFSGWSTEPSENHMCEKPFSGPSCSTEHYTMGQERAADRYLLKGHGEEQIAEVRGSYPIDQSDSERRTGLQRKKKPVSEGSKTEGEKRDVECPVCKKLLVSKCRLVTHMRLHTNERPFQCTECYKDFKRKDHLIVHMRIHTGERPYKCAVCGKAFKQRNAFLKHTLTHSHEKPFKCSQCSKGFKWEFELTLHRRMHL